MSKFPLRGLVVSTALFILGMGVVPQAAQVTFAASGRREVRIEGTVVSVDVVGGVVAIRTRSGNLFVGVSGGTKIERNGGRATLAQLKVGDFAQARFATAITEPALKLETRGP